MIPLPVIVGFGGINPAGRSSFHHGFRRMVATTLSSSQLRDTYLDLATLMNLLSYRNGSFCLPDGTPVDPDTWLLENQGFIDAHTLVRKLEKNLFDPQAMPRHSAMVAMLQDDERLEFTLRKRHVPQKPPGNWQLTALANGDVKVVVSGSMDFLISDPSESSVNSAGQLPSGFDPGSLYASRNHPRGLQLTVYGASDAINSMGIGWDTILQHVGPDQIAVYATSAMGQQDQNSNAGLMQARLMGKRVSSKQLALGFAEMPADFINAYIIGSVGSTGGQVGACATFLNNLRQGMHDIRAGRKRVVIVGNSEAPITPEIIDGYTTMGALADDAALLALDPGATEVEHHRACRPFSTNCGFTLSESAQFYVLFDDALALELGATIYGGIGDVFVNADGFKKSISGPGVGNYVTVAKAVAATRAILGDTGLQRSYVHAHGTGTPKNRVTESHILSETAKAFGIKSWPVAAVKAYLGHSIAAAAGDQLAASLGTWEYGVLPAIATIDHIASDVYRDNLDFLMQHKQVDPLEIDAAIVNAKGFGGNNATASILAPHQVTGLLEKRHGAAALTAHARANEAVYEAAQGYESQSIKGLSRPTYRFDDNVQEEKHVSVSTSQVRIASYQKPVSLAMNNPYLDEDS